MPCYVFRRFETERCGDEPTSQEKDLDRQEAAVAVMATL